MKTANGALVRTPSVVVGHWESEPFYVGRSLYYSFQINFNSASAVVKLQCSSDFGNQDSNTPENYKVINWTDIESSDVAMNGSGVGIFDVSEVGYTWVRLVIDGNTNLESARFNGKGG